jgi:hypothetical protein
MKIEIANVSYKYAILVGECAKTPSGPPQTTPLVTARLTTTRFWKIPLAGIESARSGDSIAVKNTKLGAGIRKLGF